MNLLQTRLEARVLSGFDDPSFTPAQWSALLRQGPTDAAFLTRAWQKAWWETFGRGRLLLILVEKNGAPVMLAPLYADAGMVFFVGSGGSDELDFIGPADDPEAVRLALETARELAPGFLGCKFYLVPDASPTGRLLERAAGALGFAFYDEGALSAPWMDLQADPAAAQEATRKKSLVRHENYFRRGTGFEAIHAASAEKILPHLEDFFQQHIERWAGTPFPSLFHDPLQKQFYARLTREASAEGWLRFTRIVWEGRSIAYHFGTFYRGRFLWYKPTFAADLSKKSPGEALLRQLLIRALDEGAQAFDFGIGDEAFKSRFANRTSTVRTWGLYPR